MKTLTITLIAILFFANTKAQTCIEFNYSTNRIGAAVSITKNYITTSTGVSTPVNAADKPVNIYTLTGYRLHTTPNEYGNYYYIAPQLGYNYAKHQSLIVCVEIGRAFKYGSLYLRNAYHLSNNNYANIGISFTIPE